MTVRSFCEGVAKLKFNPGDHHFLENIEIQVGSGVKIFYGVFEKNSLIGT